MSKTVNSEEKTRFSPDYSKVLKHLNGENFALPVRENQEKKLVVNIPEIFSVSEQPDKTIHLLKWLYAIGMCESVEEIVFDHSRCGFLGLSASTIMDIIIFSVREYRKEIGKKLTLRGKLPKNQMVRDVLLASGLPYHLNANYNSEYDRNRVEKFETISGECSTDKRQSGKIATELTEYFNKCLSHQKMTLREDGLLLMATLLGEVLGNCEIHGGEQATWYTQGHYEDNLNETYGEMQLLFLNLGNTIYKGLKYDSSDETKERLRYFSEKHESYFSEAWNEEMAYTVFALQEGISRLRDKEIEGYKGRGTGTVSLIETFNRIGKGNYGQIPEMTIISGQTYIKFDGQYTMKEEKFTDDPAFGNGCKKIIAFNKENDIYQPADHASVQQLKECFPGTIISLKIYLDHRYIMKEGERKHE